VPVFDLIGILLGVLSIVWGFLDWYGSSGGSFIYKGFATTGAGAVGLSVLAAASAALRLMDRAASRSTVPTAAALAGLLVTAGLLIGKPSGEQAKMGLILQLITALLQTVVFALGWLQARGTLGRAPGNVPPHQASRWAAPPPAPSTYQARAADLPSQPLPYVPPYPGAGGYPPRQPYPSYPSPGYPPPPSAPQPAAHQQSRQPTPGPQPYPPGEHERHRPVPPAPQEPHAPYPPAPGQQTPPNQQHSDPYRT
jgi:hypothetical protein